MDSNLVLPYDKEYSVTVEDAMMRVFTNSKENDEKQKAFALRHTHAYTEIFICTEGKISISTEKGNVILQAHDVAIVPAFMPHTKMSGENDGHWQAVGFSVHQRHSYEKSNYYNKLTSLCNQKETVVVRNGEEICNAVKSLCNDPCQLENLPALRLFLCVAEIADKHVSVRGMTQGVKSSPSDVIHASKLEHIIDAYYMDTLNAQKVAELLCVSKRQLSRIVNKRYGTTLRRVILDKRLTVAAMQLKNTDIPACEVAKAAGFGDSSSFYRKFRNFYGMTPAEYRSGTQNDG